MPVDITIEPGVALNSIDDDDKLPYNHVISVVDREISIDVPELVQNNVATDTYTLDLDGEWDGISPVVIFGPCESAIEVAYTNGPTTIPADVTKAYGPVDVSVVGYDRTGTVRIVTIAAPKAMNVLESGCYTGTTTEDPDPSLIGQLVSAGDAANKAAEAANTSAGNANEKAQYATECGELAVEKAGVAEASAANADEKATLATDAASAANTAANEARQAIAQLPLPDGNVPKRTLGPDAVLTADDAFSARPLGLKVYGNTRQNLWVNPSGAENGQTCTPNDDGSFTISGVGRSAIDNIDSEHIVLTPGKTYTLSVDKERTDLAGNVYGTIAVREYNSSGVQIAYNRTGGKGNQPTTFTVNNNTAYVTCSVIVGENQRTGTYRVMLNEGSKAEPWCPPGLNSVEELSIVTAGKNLFGISQDFSDLSGWLNTQLYDEGDGWVRAETALGAMGIWYKKSKMAFMPATYTVSFEAYANKSVVVDYIYITSTDNGNVGLQSYGVVFPTATTVKQRLSFSFTLDKELNGNFLIGIKSDDSSGVELHVRNMQLELGSTATDYEPPNVTTIPIDLQGNELCSLPDGTRDVLDVVTGEVEKAIGYIASYDGEEVGENYVTSALTETGEIANGAQVVYELSEPQTIQLTPPELPTLPSPNLTAYASANVEAESEMEYIRDVNVVLEKLESAAQAL